MNHGEMARSFFADHPLILVDEPEVAALTALLLRVRAEGERAGIERAAAIRVTVPTSLDEPNEVYGALERCRTAIRALAVSEEAREGEE